MPDTPLEEARGYFWRVAYEWATPDWPQPVNREGPPDLLAALQRVEAEAKAEAVEPWITWAEWINRHYGRVDNINFDPGLASDAGQRVSEASRALSTSSEGVAPSSQS